MVTTELAIVASYFICLLVITSDVELILTVLFVVAFLLPLAFYHHSWSVWLSFDHIVESLPKYAEQPSGALENRGEPEEGAQEEFPRGKA